MLFVLLLIIAVSFYASDSRTNIEALAAPTIVIKLDNKEDKVFNSLIGATYCIITNNQTTDVLIAFDDDAENWIIRADDVPPGEIPYISIKKLEEKKPETYRGPTLNEQGKFETRITLHSNGYLYVKCVYEEDDEVNFIETYERILVIDWVAPNIVVDSVLVYADAQCVSFSTKVTDRFSGLRYETANSGIKRAEFFLIDKELTEYMKQKEQPSDDVNLSFDVIREETGYSSVKVQTTALDDAWLDVQFIEDGYYYLALEDNVGNMAIYLLGHYKKPKSADFKVKYAFGYLSITDYLEQAEEYVLYYEGREDFSQIRVEELKEALSDIYYIFSTEEDENVRRQAYEQFNDAKFAFENAMKGTVVVLHISDNTNSSGMGTKIKCTNFNEDIVETVTGDELTLHITVDDVGDNDILTEVLSLIDEHYDHIIKIQYGLFKNDEYVVPNEPLMFNIDCKTAITDLKIISTIDGLNPTVYEYEKGLQYFSIKSNTNKREFYVFYNVEVGTSEIRPLNIVFIVLGIYAGLSAVITILSVMLSLKNSKKNIKNI